MSMMAPSGSQPAYVALICAAGVTTCDVTHCMLCRAHAARVRVEQQPHDQPAIRVTGVAGLDEVRARTRHELLRCHHADAQLRGDLARAAAFELARKQRVALAPRQAGKILDHVVQALLANEDADRIVTAYIAEQVVVTEASDPPPRMTQLVDRTVAGYPVQPWPQLVGALTAAQCVVSTNQHVLDHVLGIVPRAQHAAGVPGQRATMARVEVCERAVVTPADALHELGV